MTWLGESFILNSDNGDECKCQELKEAIITQVDRTQWAASVERRQLLQRRWPGDRAPVPGANPGGAAGTRRRGAAGHRVPDPATVNAESIQVDRVKGDSNMVNRVKEARIEVA